MPDRPRGDYPALDEILAELSPVLQEEARHRASQGDIPSRPADVIIEDGRVFFPGFGTISAPGIDPKASPIDKIALLWVIRRGKSHVLEVTLKTRPRFTDRLKTLQMASAFRTKHASDRYIRKAPPPIAAEVRSRLKRGQFGFLPEQFKVSEGRVFLEVGTRLLEVPDVDADQVAAGNVTLAFVLPNPAGDLIEIIWQTN